MLTAVYVVCLEKWNYLGYFGIWSRGFCMLLEVLRELYILNG